MVTTQELMAIIGGSIAGLIVLLVLLAVAIYCTCGRVRDKKHRGRSFQHLNSTTDASIGKGSNLGNGLGPRHEPRMDPRIDPRLPKVGSAGLWMGAPSMYSTGPSDAYYIDRPKRSTSLQRASSEQRLNQPANGHMVYQGNMQQLYHSQQVPSHVYHPYNSNYVHGGPYPYRYGEQRDRPIIVEYQDEEQHFHNYRRQNEDSERRGGKLRRTHSDLTGTKRKKDKKRRESPAFERTRREDRPSTASVEVHNRQNRELPKLPRNSSSRHSTSSDIGRSEEQSKTLDINDQALSSQCATDSAKLRAMQHEKSKEQDFSHKWQSKDELKLNLPASDDEEYASTHVRSYEYKGQISKPEHRSNYEHKKVSSSSSKSDGVARAYANPSGHAHSNPAFSLDEISSSSTARKDVPSPGTKHRVLEKLESNTDGKQVSAAFGFLDNYLSDDEGEGGAQSPQPFF